MNEREATRSRVMEIYEGRCANWEDPRFDHRPNKTPSLHHQIFRSEGGLTEKSNLIPLCKECHKYLHKEVEKYEKRI